METELKLSVQERERIGPEEGMKGIALHNPRAGQRQRSNSGLRKEASMRAKHDVEREHPFVNGRSDPKFSFLSQNRRSGVSAGTCDGV